MAHFDTFASRNIFTAPKPTILKRVFCMISLYNERRQLAKLSDDALADIGVTRAEAEAEAERSVWDMPAHYHLKRR